MSNKSFSFTSHGERKDVRERSGVLIYINVCITIKWIKWVLQMFSHISAINYGASQPKAFNCLFYQLFVLVCFFSFWTGCTDSYNTHGKTLKTLGCCNLGHHFNHSKDRVSIWVAGSGRTSARTGTNISSSERDRPSNKTLTPAKSAGIFHPRFIPRLTFDGMASLLWKCIF